MNNKEELRSVLLSELKRAEGPLHETISLDTLTLFNSLKELRLAPFYENLNQIISWNELRLMEYSLQEASTVGIVSKTINLLRNVLMSWPDAVLNADVERVAILFIICERLGLRPEEDLDWDIDSEELNARLCTILGKADLEVGAPANVRLSFTDNKFVLDFKEAVRLNNLKGIFEFFRAIDHGAGMWSDSVQYIKTLARVASCLDFGILSNEIAKFSPILMKVVVDAISIGKLPEFVDQYVAESPLPVLICLRRVFSSHIGIPLTTHEIDWTAVSAEVKLVKAIAQRVPADTAVSYIMDCLRLSLNKQNSATFAAFVAQNPNYIEDYARKIDFNYDESGQVSFAALVHFATENVLDQISLLVYNAFFKYLGGLEYNHHLFAFTSYFSYILHAVLVLSESSFSKYLDELELISLELLRTIHSWYPERISDSATRWIYWIMCSKFFTRDVTDYKSRLPWTYRLLDDRRFLTRLECTRGDTVIDFNWLRSFVEDSDDLSKITLPAIDKGIELAWTKTE